MMFGDQADEAESRRIVAAGARDGINFIDTADAYGGGRSEEIVGKTVRSHRDGGSSPPRSARGCRRPPDRGGIGRNWLLRGVEESLRA